MYQSLKSISVIGILLSLSACGGGDPAQLDIKPAVSTLENSTHHQANFRSVGFKGNPSGQNRLVAHNWTYDTISNTLETNDASASYHADVSSDTITLITPQLTNNNSSTTLIAYIGATASPDDIPEKIGATYVGKAEGTFDLTSEPVLYDFKGKSRLELGGTSNAPTADLRLYNLTKISGSDSSAMTFDEITVSDMVVVGTQITKGDIVALNQGHAVDLLGSNHVNESLSEFFGDTANLVAGHILSTSNKGMLHAQYSASVQP